MHSLALVTALALAAEPITIQPRARGYSIETAAVVGAAVLRPNDHVDVLAVVPDPETKQAVSLLLLQNVVIAAHTSPPGAGAHVTLLVLPEEARLLALSKSVGQLTFILRNETDRDVLEEDRAESVRSMLRHLQPAAKK